MTRLAYMTYLMQIMPNPTFALMDYPGVQRSALWGLADMFALLPRLGDDQAGPIVRIIDAIDPDNSPCDAFVFPPSIDGSQGTEMPQLLDWAIAQHQQGALACSVCAGAFWLGHAGLLDNRPATTHWALEDPFRTAFPKADLRPEHILIDDHDVITAGGLMAWLDLGLHLTGRWYGGEAVSRLARHLLIDPSGREQRHYSSFRPNRSHGDKQVLTVQRHMEQNVPAPMPAEQLAALSGMSLRTFIRRFQSATGYPPATYLQALRIEKARAALERGGESVSEIAWGVGYQDLSAFSRVFKSRTGLSPGAYRRRFHIRPSIKP